MDPFEAQRWSEEMVSKLQASILNKDKDKAKPSASKAVISVGDHLSYVPHAIIIIRSILYNVPLEPDTGVSLEPIGSSRC